MHPGIKKYGERNETNYQCTQKNQSIHDITQQQQY